MTHTSPYRECWLPPGSRVHDELPCGCAPVSRCCRGARIRTSHPSGSRPAGAGNASASPWHGFVPPENLRFQVVSKA